MNARPSLLALLAATVAVPGERLFAAPAGTGAAALRPLHGGNRHRGQRGLRRKGHGGAAGKRGRPQPRRPGDDGGHRGGGRRHPTGGFRGSDRQYPGRVPRPRQAMVRPHHARPDRLCLERARRRRRGHDLRGPRRSEMEGPHLHPSGDARLQPRPCGGDDRAGSRG